LVGVSWRQRAQQGGGFHGGMLLACWLLLACDGKPTERRENRVLASLGWKDRGESSSGRRLPAASLPALLCLRWVREEQQLLVCSVERRRAVSKRAPWLAVGKKSE